MMDSSHQSPFKEADGYKIWSLVGFITSWVTGDIQLYLLTFLKYHPVDMHTHLHFQGIKASNWPDEIYSRSMY
jgi:hypothetical protein